MTYRVCLLACTHESQHANLPPLVLKARHLSGSAYCWVDIDSPEQAVRWFPLRFGIEKINPLNLHGAMYLLVLQILYLIYYLVTIFTFRFCIYQSMVQP